MTVTLGKNIESLRSQRRLFETGDRLSSVFERLASGQRINRASDDAAGLAIASSLNADTRVFTQAIRNANDGLSMLNIADGALVELTNITIRLSELAEQSANGTFSDVQRGSLNTEAEALVDEYNRIVESTKFGEKDLFRAEDLTTRLQLGYGTNGSLEVSIGEDLARQVGDGTFQARYTIPDNNGSSVEDMLTADFDGDGNVDIVMSGFGGQVYLQLGNGDGTFGAVVTYSSLGTELALSDINNDGEIDILVHGVSGVDDLQVLLGNGDGSFRAAISNDLGATTTVLTTGDINGDGFVDAIVRGADAVEIAYGNGDGTFSAPETVLTGFNTLLDIAVGDVNGDSILDIALTDYSDASVNIYTGSGNGSFNLVATYSGGFASQIRLGDLNNDGLLDYISTATNASDRIDVSLGNGDGTFSQVLSISTPITGTQTDIQLGDINGDGILDIVQATYVPEEELRVYIGDGTGQFGGPTILDAGPGRVSSIQLADINNDGAVDILNENRLSDSISIRLGNPTDIMIIADVDLSTRESALSAMSDIEAIRDRILNERSTIGAQTSRVSVAMSNLQTSSENYTAAASRIMDADIAEESANLVRNNILQQTAAAILAQANLQPSLALQLLS